MAFVFLSTDYVWWSPALLEVAEHLSMGSSELIPCFALCVQLLLSPFNCLYLNPWVLQLLLFPFSPHPAGMRVSKRLCGACLQAGITLWQRWAVLRLHYPHTFKLASHLQPKFITGLFLYSVHMLPLFSFKQLFSFCLLCFSYPLIGRK